MFRIRSLSTNPGLFAPVLAILVLLILAVTSTVTRAQGTMPLNFAPEKGAWPVRSLAVDEWVLRGPARPDAFIDAIGRSAVWMGT